TMCGSPSLSTITMPVLDTVSGDMTINAPQATLSLGGSMDVQGDATLSVSGIGGLAMNTPGGSMDATLVTGDAAMTLAIPAGAFAGHVPFAISRITASGLDPQPGTSSSGAVTVDPIVGYHFDFQLPTLNLNATVSFVVNLAGLSSADATSLLAAVGAGQATLAVNSTQSG